MDEFDSVLSNHLDKAQQTTNGQRENYDDQMLKPKIKRLTMSLNYTNATNVTLHHFMQVL